MKEKYKFVNKMYFLSVYEFVFMQDTVSYADILKWLKITRPRGNDHFLILINVLMNCRGPTSLRLGKDFVFSVFATYYVFCVGDPLRSIDDRLKFFLMFYSIRDDEFIAIL